VASVIATWAVVYNARAAGMTVEFIVLDGYNHFEVLESLGNPYGILGRAVMKQMRLREP
jgi:arylformamidase